MPSTQLPAMIKSAPASLKCGPPYSTVSRCSGSNSTSIFVPPRRWGHHFSFARVRQNACRIRSAYQGKADSIQTSRFGLLVTDTVEKVFLHSLSKVLGVHAIVV